MKEHTALPSFQKDVTNPFVQCPAWSGFSWLKHGSSTRSLPQNRSDRLADVGTMQSLMGIENQPVVLLNQCHTANVALLTERPEVTGSSGGPAMVYEQTDAIVATTPGVTCAIFTADCVPIFVVDIKNQIIGLAHAGWKGTLYGIARTMVSRMIKVGASADYMTAWIGPSIRRAHYEVSPEMINRFNEAFADERKAGCNFTEGRLLDLPMLNRFLMERMGIASAKIFDCGICTFANSSSFHSYRAAGESAGRIVSLISLA